ncbi:MAG: HAD family hydrolase, partial [Lachnospiraceae bacterium]|nr:HAD family hydrolase [Lachnospiraceae bacterium]
MDGTILNTLEDLTDAVNHVLRGNGESVHTIDEIRSYVGNGMKKLMERAVPGGAGHPDFDRMFA